jgi:hypothetical protein
MTARRPIPKPETRARAAPAPESPSWASGQAGAEATAGILTPPATRKARRGRQWEERQRQAGRVTATYRLPEELRDRITRTAQSRSVTVDDLARVLLAYALGEYDAGRLKLNPRPREGRFTL